MPPQTLRLRRDERAWKVVFVGEFSDDYGGPYRTCLDSICAELQSPLLPLFLPCPNRRARIGFNQDKYVPDPSARLPHHLAMFEFIGKLMGVAIRTRNLLNLDLPSIIWKALVQEQITKADVIAIDTVAFRVLSMRLHCHPMCALLIAISSLNLFPDVFQATFAVLSVT